MKRRILLALFVTVVSATTVYFSLWYMGYFAERECVRSGGKWVSVRKVCYRP